MGILPTYPKQGFIALEFPDLNNFTPDRDTEFAGYSWIYARGSANESWSYLTDIHRDVEWGGDNENSASAKDNGKRYYSWDVFNSFSVFGF